MSAVNKRIRATIKLTKKTLTFIFRSLDSALSRTEIKELWFSIADAALKKTIKDGVAWINIYVAKRTGWLRETLIDTLKELSHVFQTGKLILALGTSLPYAQYVDQYNTSNVRHNNEIGYAYYHGHSGRILLNDPKAIGHYNSVMALYIRRNLRQAIHDEIFAQLPKGLRRAFTLKMKVKNQ